MRPKLGSSGVAAISSSGIARPTSMVPGTAGWMAGGRELVAAAEGIEHVAELRGG